MPLGSRVRLDVNMLGRLSRRADFDALDPGSIDDVFDQRTLLGIRFQHFAHDGATSAGLESADRPRTIGRRRRTGLCIGREERIGRLREAPRQLLEVHAVIDDTACPDVYQASVIWGIRKLFWSDVGLAPAQSR